jgi:D-alanyl-D-alanine carboxypeptidase
MNKSLLGFLLYFFAQVNPVQAQLNSSLTNALDSVFTVNGGTNITATLINQNGLVWQHAAGINSVMSNDTLLSTHIMGIGSITKTYTATLLLLLQENGQLSLDDSIHNFLPTFANVDSNITIRQLLNHTSGVYDFFNDPTTTFFDSLFSNPAHIWMPTEVIQTFTGPAYFTPGTSFYYSNTNYLLAQLIIENVTGNNYQTELHNKILTPLGLTHTYYFPFEIPVNDTIAHAWYDLDGDGITDDLTVAGFPLDGFFSAAAAAGAIVSTSADLATFMSKLLSGQILTQTSLTQMLDTVPQTGCGLGIFSTPTYCNTGWGHEGDLVYKSICASYDNGNYSLAIQTSDDKNLPGIMAGFDAIMNVYCNSIFSTSIGDLHAKIQFTMFPNPASDKLIINYNRQEHVIKQYFIYDEMGRKVISLSTESNEASIDVGGLNNGIYFVILVSDGITLATQKLSILK